jgi:uncharacterized membrane protein
MEYLVVKWLHILSSTLLFGTGLGSAFYMFFASLTRDVRAIAVVVRYVVIADTVFTATTVIVQPLTGWHLARFAGFPLTTFWLQWSIGLFFLAGACWLPVVWMQVRMSRMAQTAARDGTELPPLYWRYFRWWTALGVPAFLALVIVFYLMVVKPT